MNIAQIITNSLSRIKNYALSKFSEVDVTSNWQDSDTFSDIKNKPTSMPANGGNADTVASYKLWAGTEAEYNNAFLDDNTIYLITEVQQLGISDLNLTSQTRNSSGKLVYVLQWKVNNPSNETLTFKLSTNGGTLTTISPTLTNGTYSYTNSSLSADTAHTLYIQVIGSGGGSAQTSKVTTKIIEAEVVGNMTLRSGYYLSTDESGISQSVDRCFQANNTYVSTSPVKVRDIIPANTTCVNIDYIYNGSSYNVGSQFKSVYCNFWNASTGRWEGTTMLDTCVTQTGSNTLKLSIYNNMINFGSTGLNSQKITFTIKFNSGNGTWSDPASMTLKAI